MPGLACYVTRLRYSLLRMKTVAVFYGVVVKVKGISCIREENTGCHVMRGQQSDPICQQDSARHDELGSLRKP